LALPRARVSSFAGSDVVLRVRRGRGRLGGGASASAMGCAAA